MGLGKARRKSTRKSTENGGGIEEIRHILVNTDQGKTTLQLGLTSEEVEERGKVT